MGTHAFAAPLNDKWADDRWLHAKRLVSCSEAHVHAATMRCRA
jgi:hypothetical protein